jgi:hypothetical protein
MARRVVDLREDEVVARWIRAEETERRLGISLSKGHGSKNGVYARAEAILYARAARKLFMP